MVRKTLVSSIAGLLLAVLSACMNAPESTELSAARKEAEALSREGRIDEAIPLLERAAEISEREFGPDDPEHARSLTQLGWFHERQQDYAAAEPLYLRALGIRKAALGPKHIDVARSLNTVGQLHFQQGRYYEATVAFNRAYEIVHSTRGLVPQHRELVERSLGKAYLWDQKPGLAVWHLEEALSIEESMPDPDILRIAATLHDLGTAYSFVEETVRSKPLLERSLEIRERALGPEHPDYAESLVGLALNHYMTGEYRDAEKLLRRSLAIRTNALGNEHADVGRTYGQLAAVFHAKGDLKGAEAANGTALRILEKALGPRHGDTNSLLLQRAKILADQYRFGDVRSVLRRVLDNQPKRSERALQAQLALFRNLGERADEKGATAIATSFFEMILEVRRRNLLNGALEPAPPVASSIGCAGGAAERTNSASEIERALAVRDGAIALNDSAVAKSLNRLAILHRDSCNLAKAEVTAKRALAITVKVFGGLRRETGIVMRTLASIHAAKGELEKAELMYRGALLILERTGERPDSHLGLRLSALGRAAAAKGQVSLSESFHLMALHAREMQQRRKHCDVIPTMLDLADDYLARGELERAEPLYRHAIAVWEGTGDADPETFVRTLDTYAALLRRLGREPEAKPYSDRALAIRSARRQES